MKWLERDRVKFGSGDVEVATRNVWELGRSSPTSRTTHRSQYTTDQVVIVVVSSVRITTSYDGTKDQDHMKEAQSMQVLHHSWTLC